MILWCAILLPALFSPSWATRSHGGRNINLIMDRMKDERLVGEMCQTLNNIKDKAIIQYWNDRHYMDKICTKPSHQHKFIYGKVVQLVTKLLVRANDENESKNRESKRILCTNTKKERTLSSTSLVFFGIYGGAAFFILIMVAIPELRIRMRRKQGGGAAIQDRSKRPSIADSEEEELPEVPWSKGGSTQSRQKGQKKMVPLQKAMAGTQVDKPPRR